eukprot:Gregarina_sp_Pseudo_9__3024@NODE_322_length_3156_cov_2914_334617_g302_i0_p7_GENE_NODE_322_length_3156_cov_2914_334617_g302_i0NODE_322_length_3156_cov_2914_334617_g302_i0_p7_ORF_typecomplete_len113_score3_39Phage_holin_2_4/PF16082_5/6_3e02Phage_holin_2_4/PF16082_5/0_3_NODE_322_length_3156_cov_2914_334617_g302_i024582796
MGVGVVSPVSMSSVVGGPVQTMGVGVVSPVSISSVVGGPVQTMVGGVVSPVSPVSMSASAVVGQVQTIGGGVVCFVCVIVDTDWKMSEVPVSATSTTCAEASRRIFSFRLRN